MSRIEHIKKRKVNSLIALSAMALIVLAILVGGVYYFDAISPDDLTTSNARAYVFRTVHIVKPGKLSYSKALRMYYNEALTNDDELILIEAKNVKFIKDLQTASHDNVISVTGALKKLAAETESALKSTYAAETKGVYSYKLAVEDNWLRYFGVTLLTLVLLMILYGVIASQRRLNAALEFFDANAKYDYLAATVKVSEYVEIFDDKLVNMLGGDVVDLKKYDVFKFVEHRSFIVYTTHTTLKCSTLTGEKQNMILPKLSSREMAVLIAYLRSIGKQI